MDVKHLSILLILVLGFLFGCDRRTEDEKIAHRVIQRAKVILKMRYNLYYSGIYESGDLNGYSEIGLTFRHLGKITKDEGRKMLIDCVNTLLHEINSDPELQPYLLKKPFLPSDVWITIFPVLSDGTPIFYPDIRVFSSVRGKISYDTKSPDKEYGYFTEEKESFDEALRILEEQDKKS